MHVAAIWRYPVKTMIGATVPSAHLDAIGLRGDREWGVRDLTTGAIANTRTLGGLMQLRAEPHADGVAITLPDGTVTHSSAADVDAVLSAALGRSVTLQARPPAAETEFYRRLPSTAADPMAELREIFARGRGRSAKRREEASAGTGKEFAPVEFKHRQSPSSEEKPAERPWAPRTPRWDMSRRLFVTTRR